MDFTNCKVNNFKYYGGKNGSKICIIYNDEDYMLKFPAVNDGVEEHSYSNSCISEYVTCHIFKSLGLNVQDTIIAPIYDCASCLYPQLTDERISEIINDEAEMNARIFVFPTSALKVNDKKINYYDYVSSMENEECNEALLRVFPKINLESINKVIDETSYISDIRKVFYKKIIAMRYEKILKETHIKLTNKT